MNIVNTLHIYCLAGNKSILAQILIEMNTIGIKIRLGLSSIGLSVTSNHVIYCKIVQDGLLGL